MTGVCDTTMVFYLFNGWGGEGGECESLGERGE